MIPNQMVLTRLENDLKPLPYSKMLSYNIITLPRIIIIKKKFINPNGAFLR